MATVDRGSSSEVFERIAPLSGVGFAVLAVIALGAWGDILEPGQAVADKAPHYVDDSGAILGGAQIFVVAALLLVWFGGTLRSAIDRVVGGDNRLGAVALGGSVAAAALLLAGSATNGALALRGDEIGRVDGEVAATVGDVATLLVAAAAPAAMGIVVGATAVVALRTRALLPVWLSWVSVLLAIALVVLPINWAAMWGFFVWTIVVGLLMFLARARSDR